LPSKRKVSNAPVFICTRKTVPDPTAANHAAFSADHGTPITGRTVIPLT
jgi:hypothetical protein